MKISFFLVCSRNSIGNVTQSHMRGHLSWKLAWTLPLETFIRHDSLWNFGEKLEKLKILKIEGDLRLTRGALRVFPGGNQVDGLPSEPS